MGGHESILEGKDTIRCAFPRHPFGSKIVGGLQGADAGQAMGVRPCISVAISDYLATLE